MREYRVENFLSGWLRGGGEEENEEMQRLNEEAKQVESKSGKRDVKREGERIEIKRRCWNRVSSDVMAELLSFGGSLGFSVFVTVAPVVPVSSSDVNVIAEVVLEGSESEFVESQTFALSRKRDRFLSQQT